MKPVLKWVGGKTQLLEHIRERIPSEIDTYYEPFLGGAAVLLDLTPKKAVVNDVNSELINLYQVIKENPERLIDSLKKHKNTPEYFYALRSKDRKHNSYKKLSPITKASRIVYLNKTCFNGLFRVNSRGELNAPFGYYKNPTIFDETNIRELSAYFNNNCITFMCEDFEKVVASAKAGDFVYFDPPYDPLSSSASFTGYSANGFSRADQVRLKECCDMLNEKGVRFLLSNSSTQFILDLYKGYRIDKVNARRAISCKGDGRHCVQEVLVRNTEFLLINNEKGRHIRIECKWQQSAGSVDEKLPYLYLNCVYGFEETDIILLVDGAGFKPGAVEWLKTNVKCRWLLEENNPKKIQVMSISEFTAYFNKHLR